MVVEKAVRPAKRQLRIRLLANRAHRAQAERDAAAEALAAAVLDLPEVASATTVACYVATSEEPGTAPLLRALSAERRTVLLPILRPDFDLDWATYQPGALRDARFGLSEPTGEPLGPDALKAASVVICPGLAADSLGRRIGRGGGSYDRVLARLPAGGALRVVLLYDDEVLSGVPADDHDEPIDVVVTPNRTLRVGA